MVLIDTSTKAGQRVEQRLTSEHVIWFVTLGSKSGVPQPNLVWFLRTADDEVLMYSLNGAARIRNVEAHPQVSLHFNSSPEGGDFAIFSGEARIDTDSPAAVDNPDYLAKYGDGITSIGMTPESFSETYGTPIKVRLTGLRSSTS